MNKLCSQLEYLVNQPFIEYSYEETQWLAFYLLCTFDKNVYFDLDVSWEKAVRYRRYILELNKNGEAKTYGIPKKLISLFNLFKLEGFKPYKSNSKDAVNIVSEIKKEHGFLLSHITTFSAIDTMVKLFGKVFIKNRNPERMLATYKFEKVR